MTKHKKLTSTVFKNAPIAEVALLVQFDPLERLINKDLFELWANTPLHDLYPEVSEYAEMPAFFESFGQANGVNYAEVGRRLLLRLNYRNPKLAEQFQVQRNRAGFYWQRNARTQYPHFDHVLGKFWRDFGLMEKFLSDNKLGTIKANQCAVSYNNRIPKGKAWKNPADLSRVVTFLSNDVSRNPKVLVELENIAAMRVYVVRSKPLARMYVTFNEARGAANEMDLEFIVRGEPKTPDRKGIQGFFQIAHDSIVDMFECLTNVEMHKLWEKQ